MNKDKRILGQSLIEFALIFPIAFFLMLGLFDLGRAVFYYSSISNAVREASRSGIVLKYTDHEEDFETYLKQQVMDYGFGLGSTDDPLGSDDITVTINTFENSDGFFIEEIEITAVYCFHPITPGITLMIGTTCDNGSTGIELDAKSVMRMEPGTW